MSNIFWVGVDLGESTFAAAVAENGAVPAQWAQLPRHEFNNHPQGIRAFVTWVRKQIGAGTLAGICAEAVGPVAWRWAVRVEKHLCAVSLVNPKHASNFRRSAGIGDKTDLVDAAVLALFGVLFRPIARPIPPREAQQMQSLSRLRQARMKQLQASRNRMRLADWPKEVQEEMEADLVRQHNTIAVIDEAIEALLEKNEQLSQDARRLQGVPGVGRITAVRILAELGDLRQYTREEIVALAGLNPVQHRSGTSVERKPHLSKAGNASLRSALYFPAISASRYCPQLKAFAQRLLANGKPKQAVIGAVMRKLLLILRAMLVQNQDYCENPEARGKFIEAVA